MSAKLSESERDLMNSLYQDCGLEPSDIYVDKRGFKLITRAGIEKIQSVKKIKVTFEHVKIEPEFCVIKAIGDMNGDVQETYGSASKLTSMNKYYPEMAEKRALARVVLKLTKGYQHGLMSEDEMDMEEKEIRKKKTIKRSDTEWKEEVLPFIRSMSNTMSLEDMMSELEKDFIINMSMKKTIKNEYDN
jgi:hypothetical protein